MDDDAQLSFLKLENLEKPLDAIKCYLDSVCPYIYSEIEHNYSNGDKRHLYSWALHVISTNLMRSLYLRNAFVEMVNSKNYVSALLQLKAWVEIAACLAAVRSILISKDTLVQKQTSLSRYVLGNRGKGMFRVGHIDAPNVQAMIQKADKLFEEIMKVSDQDQSISKYGGKFFTDFYDNASNGSHPNGDSAKLVSSLEGKKTVIKGWDKNAELFLDQRGEYGGLLMTPMFIEIICKDLFDDFKEEFRGIDSRYYFEI